MSANRSRSQQPAAVAAPLAEPALVCLADVAPQPIRWLWPGRIALGKPTLIVGDPGLGKSFLTLWLAAQITTGREWPDDPLSVAPLGDAILLNAEDDAADTIRPRLDAAAADPSRVIALQGVRRIDPKGGPPALSLFTLHRDIPMLKAAIKKRPETKLVVIDPVSAFLGDVDSHNNSEVRALLAPLAQLAAEEGVALVIVSHLNKSGMGKAVYRTTGSLAFPAAARAVWAVTRDQEDDKRRLFLPIKNNIAEDQGGLAFRIIDGALEWEPDPVAIRADEAMAGTAERDAEQRRGVVGDAVDFLIAMLSE